MTYKALYRQWRPARWADVVNQKPVVRILQNALLEDKVSHAYLFSGPRGTGKTTVARLLAKSVNCQNLQGAEPCNQCDSCTSITQGSSVDVIEIDAASNRGIDEIRALRESVRYLPASSKYKVYIIDEVHMLTQEAFNALLKTIEEPPPRVLFIMATTAPHKLPLTITSRCQRLEFKRLSVPDIQEHMKKILAYQGVTWDDASLYMIARNAQGSMRDALSILDLCVTYGEGRLKEEDVRAILGETPGDTMMRLFRAISQKDLRTILETTKEVSEQGKDMGEFSMEIGTFARDLLLIKTGQKPSFLGRERSEAQDMMALSRSFSWSGLISILEMSSQAINGIKQSDSPRLVLEIALMGLFLKREGLPQSSGAIEEFQRPDQASVSNAAPNMVPDTPANTVPNAAPSHPAAEKQVQSSSVPRPALHPEGALPKANEDSVNISDAIELVKAAWPQLLENLLKKRKLKARAYLLPGSPLRIEKDNNLVLGYEKGYATHMEQIMVQDNKAVVEKELEKITGKKFSLAVEVFDLNKANGGNGNGDEMHPLVKAAIDFLGGKLEEEPGEESGIKENRNRKP